MKRAIPLGDAPLGETAAEVARIWITDGGGATVLIDPGVLDDAEMFGVLMADTIDHAAKAHAEAMDMTEEQAAALIWRGVDRARAAIEQGSSDLDQGGRIN
jgi:glyoxylase-like metal-dependent hydrolase (beta-lactamase superfamily II)